jgi:hypothetical protein
MMKMLNKLRIALALTLFALAAAGSASGRPRLTDITDGTSQTLMIGELGGGKATDLDFLIGP